MNESEMAKIIKTVTEYEIQIIKLKDEKTNAIAKIEELFAKNFADTEELDWLKDKIFKILKGE